MDSSTSKSLLEYVNSATPLGPIAAEDIKNDEVSAHLFDRHNSTFNTLISSDVDIIVGRRGSGKTALLRCYRLASIIGRNKVKLNYELGQEAYNYSVVVDVSSDIKFYEMQLFVIGPYNVHKPIDLVVSEWGHLIGNLILDEVVSHAFYLHNDDNLKRLDAYLNKPQTLQKMEALQLVWGRKSVKAKDIITNVPHTQEEALDIAEAFLKKTGGKVAVIFDSMDEYKVGDPVADRTIGALLRHLRQFNSIYKRMRIKVALPSEIFPEIQRTSANPLKDLAQVEQISWTSMELMQMAAHRYRLFLQLHDTVAFNKFADLDFNHRSSVNKFWNTVFSGKVMAQEGIFEHPIIFILRHTQLLPRQFLVILQKIIVASYNETGGYRELKSDLVVPAVEKNNIPAEIYSAYKDIYPTSEKTSRALFGNFPPIFKYEELEERWKRVGRPLSYESTKTLTEFSEIVDMLLRMGVLGVADQVTEMYVNTEYSYQSKGVLNTGLGGQLCVHPIFIRELGCDLSGQKQVVRPSGVLFHVEAEG